MNKEEKERFKAFVKWLESNKWYKQSLKENVPRCLVCGKKFINAIDSHTGKKSKYLWKATCEHLPQNLRLSMG